MIKTSINLSHEDLKFCLTKGRNMTFGIRHCIDYTRNCEQFKNELLEIINNKLPQCTDNQKQEINDSFNLFRSKICGIMEN